MPDDQLIVALRAARDAVMADAPPRPAVAANPHPSRSRLRSPRLLAVVTVVVVMASAAVGIAMFTGHGTGRGEPAAGPATPSSLADPYDYKSITRSYPTGAHMRTETWFPVSGVGPYMTRVTMTGPDKWSGVTTPDGKGVYVFRSTCGAVRPAIPIAGAPYSRLFCPPGERTVADPAPGRTSAKINSWDWPTPKFLATLPTDPVQLGREVRVHAIKETGGRGTAADVAQAELDLVEQILTQGGYIPPAVSAAFRAVVAALPGIHASANAKNLDGDVGTEYTLVIRLFDPTTNGRSGAPYADGRLIFDRAGTYLGTGYGPDLVTGKDRYPEYGVTSYAGGSAATAGGTPHLNG